jgi:hypothetical protein
MPKSNVYIATIQIAIVADHEDDACEVLSGALRPLMAIATDDPAASLLDWAYLRVGRDYLYPQAQAGGVDLAGYEEGDLFSVGRVST